MADTGAVDTRPFNVAGTLARLFPEPVNEDAFLTAFHWWQTKSGKWIDTRDAEPWGTSRSEARAFATEHRYLLIVAAAAGSKPAEKSLYDYASRYAFFASNGRMREEIEASEIEDWARENGVPGPNQWPRVEVE